MFQSWRQPGIDVPQALADELYRRYSTKEGYDLFPDVMPFFQMLRTKSSTEATKPWPWEKTVVGIITNSDDRVPGVLNSFGLKVGPRRVGTPDQRAAEAALEDDISFVVLSYDVGVEKPRRAIFDAAAECLKETLSGRDDGLQVEDFEKLYVGDTLQHDVFGAEGAGWYALLLDRSNYYKKAYARVGKGLVSKTMKQQVRDGFTEVGIIENLEALNDWYPANSKESSPGSSGSENERAA